MKKKNLFNIIKREIVREFEITEMVVQERLSWYKGVFFIRSLSIYGLIKIIRAIIVLIMFRFPLWWPFCITVHFWGLMVKFIFLPIIYFLENKSNKENEGEKKGYWNSILIITIKLEWIIKTLLGITYIMDSLLQSWHRRKEIWWSFFNFIEKKLTIFFAWILKHLYDWRRYKNKVVRFGERVNYYSFKVPYRFYKKWVDPRNYKPFRWLWYRKNRTRLKMFIYCRLSIRYHILKGLIKYYFIVSYKTGPRKSWRWIKHFVKQCARALKPRRVYNRIVWKWYKCVYYIGLGMIYVWAGIVLFFDLLSPIFFITIYPIFYLIWLFIYLLLYLFSKVFLKKTFYYQDYKLLFINKRKILVKITRKQINNKKEIDEKLAEVWSPWDKWIKLFLPPIWLRKKKKK